MTKTSNFKQQTPETKPQDEKIEPGMKELFAFSLALMAAFKGYTWDSDQDNAPQQPTADKKIVIQAASQYPATVSDNFQVQSAAQLVEDVIYCEKPRNPAVSTPKISL